MKLPYIIRPVVLKINPDRQGKYAIKICAYHRKTQERTYRDTEHRVKIENWNKQDRQVRRSDPSYQSINMKVQQLVQETEDKIRKLFEEKRPIEIEVILSGDNYNSANIFEYAQRILIESVGKLKEATIEARTLDMTRIRDFSGPNLTFDQVDKPFLRQLENHLRQNLANNTVHRVFKTFKTVFNEAIGDEVTARYPFKGNKNPKYLQTQRTFLTQEELTVFVDYTFKINSPTMKLCGLLFCLGSYSSLRLSDWFQFMQDPEKFIHDGQLVLYAEKNGDIVSMPIGGTLKKVISEIRNMIAHGAEAPAEQTINQYIRLIAEADDVQIKKHITTHVARHTYGCRCATNGIPPALAAKRMGITLKTVMVYYHIMGATVKEAFKKMDKM